MVVNTIEKMKELGFSEYECRAYLSLLEENPVTAYELSKKSGIPSSKIYEILSRLLEKEAAYELVESGKKRYIPAHPDEIISSFSAKINETLDSLKSDFNNLEFHQNVSYLFNIDNYASLLKRAESLIVSAREKLLISAWDTDLEKIRNMLNQKNIPAAVVNFGETVSGVNAMVYPHPVGHTLFSEKGGRQFVICADSKEAVSGTIYNDGTAEAAWSRNEGFVSLAEDFIKHDIYILKVVNRFNDMLISTYGDNFEKMRNIFSDEVIS